MRVDKRIRYNYFRSIQLFWKRAHVWNFSLCKSFMSYCERFEPRSHFKRLSLIVRVNVVVNRTVVVDSDWRFDNLCGIGRLSVKPWCYWLWRLVCSLANWAMVKATATRTWKKVQKAKQQFCTCSTLFGTFLCCPCTTTTWNFLMRRFVRLPRLRDIFFFFSSSTRVRSLGIQR